MQIADLTSRQQLRIVKKAMEEEQSKWSERFWKKLRETLYPSKNGVEEKPANPLDELLVEEPAEEEVEAEVEEELVDDSFDVEEIESEEVDEDVLEELKADYRSVLNLMDTARKQMEALAGDEQYGVHVALQWTAINKHIKDAVSLIRYHMPHVACPECEGFGCTECAQAGFITRSIEQGIKRHSRSR